MTQPTIEQLTHEEKLRIANAIDPMHADYNPDALNLNCAAQIIRATLTAQAGDGNRLPEEIDARKLAHDLMGQYALLDQHIEDFGEDSDEAFAQFSRIVSLLNKTLRAAIQAAKDGAG